MVYVKIIKEESNKITCELLNLNHGEWCGNGIDRVLMSKNPCNNLSGYRVTQEDFESLYRMKDKEYTKRIESNRTDEEKEKIRLQEEINNLREEKMQREKRFYHRALKYIKSLLEWQ